jgi:hypothetical protein
LSGRFAQIEKRRLVRLAAAWLEHEKARAPFKVIAVEAKVPVEIGGLRLSGRLDRVDELADGRRIVIDYKTGDVSVGDWLGERPDEPQLPLYVIAVEPEPAALAYAGVKAGRMCFTALARDDDMLPETQAFPPSRYQARYNSWQHLLDDWRVVLRGIAGEFARGNAHVDPKQYPQTCSRCEAVPLCRIHERLAANSGAPVYGDE